MSKIVGLPCFCMCNLLKSCFVLDHFMLVFCHTAALFCNMENQIRLLIVKKGVSFASSKFPFSEWSQCKTDLVISTVCHNPILLTNSFVFPF